MLIGDDDEDIADLVYLQQLAAAHDEDDDPECMLFSFLLLRSHERASPLFRKRWVSVYVRDLPVNEGSFLAEYRVDSRGFQLLNELLEESISRDEIFISKAMSKSGSTATSTASRLGSALIMLGGGRKLESMRRHGLAQATVYDKFHRVFHAINLHSVLAITCDNSITGFLVEGTSDCAADVFSMSALFDNSFPLLSLSDNVECVVNFPAVSFTHDVSFSFCSISVLDYGAITLFSFSSRAVTAPLVYNPFPARRSLGVTKILLLSPSVTA
jgi:hypothetical protein